jgi:hypothetical protein
MSPERLQLVTTRSGHVNVEVDGVPYHSRFNPLSEVQQFYRPHSLEEADVVLHFGWGLGYGGEILWERLKKSARVIVLEPDDELFKFSLSQVDNHTVFQDSRFQFVVGAQVRRFFDNWNLEGCQETDQFLWLIWPTAYQADAGLANTLRQKFQKKSHRLPRAYGSLTPPRGEYLPRKSKSFRYPTRSIRLARGREKFSFRSGVGRSHPHLRCA